MNKTKPKILRTLLLLPCAAAVLFLLLSNPGCTGFFPTGWVEQDGQFYYYNEDHQLHTGWLEEDGKRHYFDENGVMMTEGWLELDGSRYLIVDGSPVTGWLEADGVRRYFDPAEGFAVTGIRTIEGVTYGFNTDGSLASGWLEADGVTYRISEDGTPLPGGWLEVEGVTYYLAEDGSLYEGWLTEEGHTYYMQAGIYTTGILPLDGRNYFFDSRGWNILMVNPWNTVPEGYEVDVVTVGGDHYIAAQAAVDFCNMIYTLQQAEMGPIITSSYRTGTRQQEIFDERMAGYMEQGMTEEEAYAKTATSVAIPGTSEHQLGLAMDMTDAQYNKLDEGQMETPTQLWLIENSWKYGFILRYPDGKSEITGIIYEPWHYRYVGKELAAELYELGLTMEEYLDMLTEDKTLTASNPENGNTMK